MHSSSSSSNARSVLSSWFSAEDRGPSTTDDHHQAPSYTYAPVHPTQAKRLEKRGGFGRGGAGRGNGAAHPHARGGAVGRPHSAHDSKRSRHGDAADDDQDDFFEEGEDQQTRSGPRSSRALRGSKDGSGTPSGKQQIAQQHQGGRSYNREAFDYRSVVDSHYTPMKHAHPESWRSSRSPASVTPKRFQQRRTRFKEHLSAEEVEKGLKDGTLLQGVLRVNHKRMRLAYVSVEGFDKDILIDGVFARNRAFEGDTVVIRLNDPSEWEVVKDKDDEDEDEDEDEATGRPDDDDEEEEIAPAEDLLPLDDSLVDAMTDSEDEEIPNGTSVPVESKPVDVDVEEAPKDHAHTTASTDEEVASNEEADNVSEEESEEENEGTEDTAAVSAPASTENPPARGWWQPSAAAAAAAASSASDDLSKEPTVPPVKKGKRCWRCKGVGHISRDCTAARKESRPAEREAKPAKQPIEIKEGGEVKLRRTAKVVAITKSNHVEEMVGYLKPCGVEEEELGKGNFLAFFVPLEKRMPRILVPVKRLPASLISHPNELTTNLFVCKLSGWPATSAHPKGELIKNMGCSGDMEVELRVLLEENGIDWEDSFSPEVLACLPDVPPLPARWQIPAEEVAKRRDLRKERIFTIDPATAKDMDDAVSCKPLPDGTFLVGVHIADVTYFVKPDTPLDKEGKKRATTVYMVHRSIPMLPRLLSDNMCSLVPGEDRLSFSVMWRMNRQGDVLDEPWFGRSIIRSCVKMSYEAAQEMIDGTFTEPALDSSASNPAQQSTVVKRGSIFIKDPTAPEHRVEDIIEDVKVLNEMAVSLRKSRFDEGSLTLEDAKMYFCLDDDKMPIDVGTYVRTASHFLIEEFMLLANKSVAKRIYEAYPDRALLRRHPPPNDNKLSEFITMCKGNSIDFDTSCSKGFQRSLDALSLLPNPSIAVVVTRLAMKPMSVAKYTCTDEGAEEHAYRHYALAFDHYTHFTSPIRRYADVVVHRLLDAALQGAPAPLEKDDVISIADNCNTRKTKADKAQDKCDLVFLCTLLKNHPPKDLDATVITVNSRSFEVYIPLYGVEKLARAEDLHLAKFDHDKKRQTLYLHWKRDGANLTEGQQQAAKTIVQEIKPFTQLKVRLYPDLQRRPIDVRLAIVPPEGAAVPANYYDDPRAAPAAASAEASPARSAKSSTPKHKGYKPLRRSRGDPAVVGERPSHEDQQGGDAGIEEWLNEARTTEAQQRQQTSELIDAFIKDATQTKLHLRADLTANERRIAHEVAEDYGLYHHSSNYFCPQTGTKQRRLTLFKKPPGAAHRARSRSMPASTDEGKDSAQAGAASSVNKTPTRPKKPYKSKSVVRPTSAAAAPGAEDGAASSSAADALPKRRPFRKTKEGVKERVGAVRDQLAADDGHDAPPTEVRTKVARPKRTFKKHRLPSAAPSADPAQTHQVQPEEAA